MSLPVGFGCKRSTREHVTNPTEFAAPNPTLTRASSMTQQHPLTVSSGSAVLAPQLCCNPSRPSFDPFRPSQPLVKLGRSARVRVCRMVTTECGSWQLTSPNFVSLVQQRNHCMGDISKHLESKVKIEFQRSESCKNMIPNSN